MKERRNFAIIWTALSIVGFLIFTQMKFPLVGYFLGFHLVKDLSLFLIVTGLYSKYPEVVFVFIGLLLLFIVLWVLSLVRIKHSRLFEFLVLVDSIIPIIIYSVMAIIRYPDVAWEILVGLIIKNVILFLIIAKRAQDKKHRGCRNTGDENTGDGSVCYRRNYE